MTRTLKAKERKLQKAQERRRVWKAAGMCVRCGATANGKTECEPCKKKRKAYQKDTYWNKATPQGRNSIKEKRVEWIAKGLCSRCGKNTPVRTRKTCAKCLNRKKIKIQELKDVIYKAYGGAVCNCCGEDIRVFLTLDHIDNNGAKHRKELGKATATGRGLYLWIIREKFPPIFQVLCYNCNCGKSRNNGVCPHKQIDK